MTFNHIDVVPLGGNIGAEIHGVDLSQPLETDVVDEIRQALLDNLVIFFRDQDITPDQQKNFGRLFGELHIHPFIPTLDGHPEIIRLRSQADGPGKMSYQSNQWHTDLTYTAEPPMGSILWSDQSPEAGGDTMFMNLYAAFDALSKPMQTFLENLTAVHNIVASMHVCVDNITFFDIILFAARQVI